MAALFQKQKTKLRANEAAVEAARIFSASDCSGPALVVKNRNRWIGMIPLAEREQVLARERGAIRLTVAKEPEPVAAQSARVAAGYIAAQRAVASKSLPAAQPAVGPEPAAALDIGLRCRV